MILRPCISPGCTNLVPRGSRCNRHAKENRDKNPQLALATRIRNSSRWARVREAFRRDNPVCRDPLGLHPEGPEPTQDVHHIVPLIERPDLAFDPSNLAPLCTRCHQAIEQKERKGEVTRTLFTPCPDALDYPRTC